ncbi:MAG TPA: HAMP domain-containing sensor histidine kinase [Candidatus Limnocylindria bacterium]|nr:HAMP domain-containing sensor histidine kinase [Candidatus Limnocylindria bacterium]
MTFRIRVAVLAASAVAVAALGAAAIMYVVVQDQLNSQLNQTLIAAAAQSREADSGGSGRGGERMPPFPGARGSPLSGRPDIGAQLIDSSGRIGRVDNQPVSELVTPDTLAVANGTKQAFFFDTQVDGSHVRSYVAPFTPGSALQLWRPLDEIDRVLDETRLRLAVVALGAIALAALLGVIVSQGTLMPVRRLTEVVEEVGRTRDLSRRVAGESPDELGRLAASFNGMLGALEISLRQQRQLVADASHELRTPLTSLRTNLELLARGQPTDPAERQQVLVELVAQMERLSTLVGDLIDLARDEEATLPIEVVRLDEVVAEAITDVRGRYPRVRFEAAIEETTVRGIRPRIARAVTNLLDNAGKWSPAGGVVEVTVRAGEVSVRDHGPGVSPEDAPRVFDRFWRAPNARSLPGSGLGLSIVKDVAESHGGSVTVEHANGGGARFRLRLATSS